jgi:putative flavoprotein involved in K+ transport
VSDATTDRRPNELERRDPEAIVVGGGAAGLSSAAMLGRAGVNTLVLEESDRLAPSWRSRYEGLRLNTLGWMSTQPGYHVGRRARHFPSREQWIDYLERYARHHQVRIRFETRVERIDRADGGWRVETLRGRFRPRFVVVATGYDRQPKMPAWPGREGFTGELIHAADFRNVAPYRGRDVLIVSAGVTGSELAFFLAEGGAARVRVAVRTPPTILRRCRFGVPINPAAVLLDRLPAAIGDRAAAISQWMTFGDLSAYGLARPRMGAVSSVRKRRVGPAIDDGFVGAVKEGMIEILPAVEAFEGPDVVLAGGERIQPDAVIAATGYSRGLEPLVGHLGVLDERGEPKFLGGETPPDSPGLYFVGYRVRLSGPLRHIRLDAKRMARAVARTRQTARSRHE